MLVTLLGAGLSSQGAFHLPRGMKTKLACSAYCYNPPAFTSVLLCLLQCACWRTLSSKLKQSPQEGGELAHQTQLNRGHQKSGTVETCKILGGPAHFIEAGSSRWGWRRTGWAAQGGPLAFELPACYAESSWNTTSVSRASLSHVAAALGPSLLL